MGRFYNHLSLTEREEISRAIALGRNPSEIARDLGRSRSTIMRELKRNSACPAVYRAARAHLRAHRRACRPRRQRKLRHWWLARYVQRALLCGWSPEQIAARLKHDCPLDMSKRISHETIYAAIYIIPRGELPRAFLSCLRQHRKRRRPRSRGSDRRGQIPNRTAIALRPPGSGQPARARPLGRRSDQGQGQWLGGGHLGRAHHAPGGAGAHGRARFRQRVPRLRAQTATRSPGPAQILDLRSGPGDGPT